MASSTLLPALRSARHRSTLRSRRMSISDTHTRSGGSGSVSSRDSSGLHQGWSRLAPPGSARRQAERGGCVMVFSDTVRASPPKKGWTRTTPLSTSGDTAPPTPRWPPWPSRAATW
nr:unnamed protein product [Digitaria exilis]